ncbi:hypothetical protein [Spirillospora sp. NPDC029432]
MTESTRTRNAPDASAPATPGTVAPRDRAVGAARDEGFVLVPQQS